MALNLEDLMKIIVKAAEDKKAGGAVALNLTGISLINTVATPFGPLQIPSLSSSAH